MTPSDVWMEKYGRFWDWDKVNQPKEWYQLTTKELYDLHMDTYTQDTAVLSMTKHNHPSYQYIKNHLGMRAVPYLLKDIQAQHPDGSFDPSSYHSFWGACSLFREILFENGIEGPEIPEPFRGRLEHIRRIYVEWGVQEEFLANDRVPSRPLTWGNLHRFTPHGPIQNWVWRITTLPNRHRMKHKWDFWRAV